MLFFVKLCELPCVWVVLYKQTNKLNNFYLTVMFGQCLAEFPLWLINSALSSLYARYHNSSSLQVWQNPFSCFLNISSLVSTWSHDGQHTQITKQQIFSLTSCGIAIVFFFFLQISVSEFSFNGLLSVALTALYKKRKLTASSFWKSCPSYPR